MQSNIVWTEERAALAIGFSAGSSFPITVCPPMPAIGAETSEDWKAMRVGKPLPNRSGFVFPRWSEKGGN